MAGSTIASPNEGIERAAIGSGARRRLPASRKGEQFLIEEARSVRELRHVWSFGHTVMVRIPERGASEVSIVPANIRFSIGNDDRARVIAVGLKVAFVACNAAGLGRAHAQLRHLHGIDDALIVEMVRTLRAETGKPGNARLVQTLATALAMHVVSKYGPDRSAAALTEDGLGRQQLEAVVNYINENCAGEICISELARIAGLSLSHFIRVFKQSTGLSPHQYVLRARLGRAQELLTRTRYSITEVASMTGFCGQSHFTKLFRRLLGTTPRRYRQKMARPRGGLDGVRPSEVISVL